MKPKVLIIDDSALVRQLLTEILSRDGGLEVVGAASDPCAAQEKILRLKPDVITLDVEMPRMDGLTFLEKLMRSHPLPVVMVSSLTERGCDTTLRALELGAVDFVTKPKLDVSSGVLHRAGEIVAKVKAAAGAKVRARRSPAPQAIQAAAAAFAARPLRTTDTVVAIGASTGGTEALREVLCALPPDSPGTVIVQHMPEKFTASFAARLNSLCRMEVREARDGDRVLTGLALIAPGDRHMQLVRNGADYRAKVFTAEPVNHHRPSVDVLFHSCAVNAGANATGIILTGMGNDGARGLLAMREAGARTFAQDEATCVVFGMPKEAIAMGAAQKVLPLERMAAVVG